MNTQVTTDMHFNFSGAETDVNKSDFPSLNAFALVWDKYKSRNKIPQYEIAKLLGTQASALSQARYTSFETPNSIPEEWTEKFAAIYQLTYEEKNELEFARLRSLSRFTLQARNQEEALCFSIIAFKQKSLDQEKFTEWFLEQMGNDVGKHGT